MRRRVNLRQIEVFKAVIEDGKVSSAAAALNIFQPAMSKSLAQLKADSKPQTVSCCVEKFTWGRGRPNHQWQMGSGG